MHDEEAFLATLREQPEDDDSRLIYADWLEERGDPRAEYLRVEYDVRVQGAEGEERLRALRSQLNEDWLRAVHDGKLGPDWAIKLQDATGVPPSLLVPRICEITGLSTAEAERAVRACPVELQRGLRYWQAHRLRLRFADMAHVTVELEPATNGGGGPVSSRRR